MPKSGFITGSRFSDMLTQGRGKALWGKTSEKLAIRIAAERLGILDLNLNGYTSESMQWGLEQEEEAIKAYERETFIEVHGKQLFQPHSKHEWVGCTPDGLVGDEGMIEVKNPDSENHLFHILDGWQIKKYKDQVQGSLWVTGREWCDFVSHDSRMADDRFKLHITRIERDEDYIHQIEERYLSFEEKVEEQIEKLEQL